MHFVVALFRLMTVILTVNYLLVWDRIYIYIYRVFQKELYNSEFLIPQLDEDDQEGRIHFQQDGAPPHYLGEVREYLNTRFPGRWIGRA